MLRLDPLDWFIHEKVAADAPTSAGVTDRYRVPREIRASAADPGERALAGILTVAGSVSAKVLPAAGRIFGNTLINRSSEELIVPPIQGVRSMQEARQKLEHSIEVPPVLKNRVLGLFDITQAHPPLMAVVGRDVELAKRFAKQDETLNALSKVVDSYLDKHKLIEKGVRINLQSGPISGLGGGSYMPPTKEVYIPRLGAEVALHELGHASDYTTRTGKIRSFVEPVLNRGVLMALPIALAVGDQIKEMIPGTVDDTAIEFMQNHAAGIMAATLAATTLYPEAKASISAIRHIRDLERAGKQPAGATLLAAKRLSPLFGSYLLGAIPAVVGMAVAKKYMNQARAEKKERQESVSRQIRELEKTSSMMGGFHQIADVGIQIGRGAIDLMRQPHTLRRIGQAAKEVGTSPEFVRGALGAAVPAALGALYMYGTSGGEEVRSRLHPETRDRMLRHKAVTIGPVASTSEKWRSEHPLRFAGLVAMGAALSGGTMSRFIHDLTRVL